MSLDLYALFEEWRSEHDQGWGLAWFLAAELCERFYRSHGICPQTLCREGLGYYGIGIDALPCRIRRGEGRSLGRLTADGNVENWRTGEQGDHGLNLVDRLRAGESVELMVAEAIRHLALSAMPRTSHLNCRHKRWGDSYVLLFRVAAALALRHGEERVTIWNDSYIAKRRARGLDREGELNEHPGYFSFEPRHGPENVIIRGDGVVLRPEGQESRWELYLSGCLEIELLRRIEAWTSLGLSSR